MFDSKSDALSVGIWLYLAGLCLVTTSVIFIRFSRHSQGGGLRIAIMHFVDDAVLFALSD